MPHLVLSYSNNMVIPESLFSVVFEQLHQLLAEGLPTSLSSCKSRVLVHDIFCIGDGNRDNAFVHLAIKILSGRSDEKKNQLGIAIYNCVKEQLLTLNSPVQWQLSVEIMDLSPHYFKG